MADEKEATIIPGAKTLGTEITVVEVKNGPTKKATIITGTKTLGSGDKRQIVPEGYDVESFADVKKEHALKTRQGGRGERVVITTDGQKLRFDAKTGALLALLLALMFGFQGRAAGQGLGRYRSSLEIPSIDAPTCLKPASGLVVSCYQGNVYQGNGAVLSPATITYATSGAENATTLTAVNAENSCPTSGSCNFIYVTSGGVLSITSTLATAFAANTSPLYYVGTSGGNVVLVQPVWRDTGGPAFATATGSGQAVLSTSPSLVTPVTTLGSTAVAATLSPTCAAQSGQVILVGALAGEVVTLPTPAVGCYFDFIITVSNTSNSNEIQTGAAQFLLGSVSEAATAGAASVFWADGSATRAIKMNGTTTGGLIGSEFHVVGISTTQWEITGMNEASGAIATAFTATP